MDANKREKLIQIGYTIPPSCGQCHHRNFTGQSLFGTCTIHSYDHERHSVNPRQLSVCRYGTCDEFVRDPLIGYDGFEEFTTAENSRD